MCPICKESNSFRSELACKLMDGETVGTLTDEQVVHLFVHEWTVDGSALDGLYFVRQAIGTESDLFKKLESVAIQADTAFDPTPFAFMLA